MEPGTKRIFKVGVSAVLIAAVALLAFEVLHWLTHVYASNAGVQTELTRMSSRVDGTIDKIMVTEGDIVGPGQPLVALAANDIRLRIETLRTDLSLEEAERARLESEKAAYEFELDSSLKTKHAQISAHTTEYNFLADRLALAENELRRVRVLSERKLASEKTLTAEQDKVLALRGRASMAKVNIQIAKRALEQEESRRKQIAVIKDKIRISGITTARIKKQIELEEVSNSHRLIRSPVAGIIDRVYKYPGEYVEEGESILILHNKDKYWLEAHVDEDNIRHVQMGQQVIIEFEAYPFKEFLGKVQRIGSVTTRKMGIAEDSGGQFGRSSERVPVIITIEQSPPILTPGMIANVNIKIDGIRLW